MKKSPFTFHLPEILLIAMVLFSAVMLGFSSGKFIVSFNSVGFTVFSSLQKGLNSVVYFFTDKVDGIKEISNLKQKYARLKDKLEDYEQIKRVNTEYVKENERLKSLLDFRDTIEYKNIPARIIGRDPDALYSGITINKGARHGVRKGMSVIAVQNGDRGIVGKIVTVGYGTSIIMPVYDSQCHISVRIQNTRDVGIVSGTGTQEKYLKLNYIRKRLVADFHTGDIIVTSGENGNYLADIPVGRISNITSLDYSSSLDIDVDPIIDFARLEHVIIIDLTEAAEKKTND
ncbi:rod shape-determining protein MreC [Treponema sp.]|uniref:rod shape-determining protein MreC n=1 Tax=Treponema sp. TaxID=166 RepID=UPI0025D4EC3E|nr:rod shape-determining protein MreC [Treponema sp.]MCR5217521.1 rod shape-determining protein MreC [Treponema sp.]